MHDIDRIIIAARQSESVTFMSQTGSIFRCQVDGAAIMVRTDPKGRVIQAAIDGAEIDATKAVATLTGLM